MLTQVYGVRGKLGNLWIEPKLVREQFTSSNVLVTETSFMGKDLSISFYNRESLDYGEYQLGEICINDEVWDEQINGMHVELQWSEMEKKLISNKKNKISIEFVRKKG